MSTCTATYHYQVLTKLCTTGLFFEIPSEWLLTIPSKGCIKTHGAFAFKMNTHPFDFKALIDIGEKMSGFSINIEEKTLSNNYFRQVLYTAKNSQLVVMTLQAGEEIGQEKHEGHDQFIRVEAGTGIAILDGEKHALEDGTAVVIPAGTEHNVINTSSTEPLRLYTLYSPPEHPDGIVHRTKAEADEYERQHGH